MRLQEGGGEKIWIDCISEDVAKKGQEGEEEENEDRRQLKEGRGGRARRDHKKDKAQKNKKAKYHHGRQRRLKIKMD